MVKDPLLVTELIWMLYLFKELGAPDHKSQHKGCCMPGSWRPYCHVDLCCLTIFRTSKKDIQLPSILFFSQPRKHLGWRSKKWIEGRRSLIENDFPMDAYTGLTLNWPGLPGRRYALIAGAMMASPSIPLTLPLRGNGSQCAMPTYGDWSHRSGFQISFYVYQTYCFRHVLTIGIRGELAITMFKTVEKPLCLPESASLRGTVAALTLNVRNQLKQT